MKVDSSNQLKDSPIQSRTRRDRKTLSTRWQVIESPERSPGPGTYFQNEGRRFHSTAPYFPKSPRMKLQNEKSPGPTSYDIQIFDTSSNREKGFRFNQEQRCVFTGKTGPAPGQYDLPLIPIKRKVVLKKYLISKTFLTGKPKDYLQISRDLFAFPSPLNYTPKIMGKTSGWLFPKARRNSQKQKEVPGPGQYSVQPNRKFKLALSTTQRMNVSYNETPGPGAYDLKAYNSVDQSVRLTAIKKDLL